MGTNQPQLLVMTSQLQSVVISAIMSMVVGDLNTYNTYYPDYSDAYDKSSVGLNQRYKRVINVNVDNPISIATTLDLTFPLPDISSEILVTVPFSLDFPTATSRSASGRSFSSSVTSPRSTMYKTIEKYMSQITGADGHACLLRAMCEASATPLHDEGILGDAVNFLLTANYASIESDDKFKEYLKAQTEGQLKENCSGFNTKCPISFFNFLDNNIL